MHTIPPTDALDLLHRVPRWHIGNGTPARIERTFKTTDFSDALALVNRIAAIADANNHHPDVCFGWGYVTLSLSTHEAGGLTHADFDLAEAIDGVAGS